MEGFLRCQHSTTKMKKKKKKTERRINDILNIRAMQFTTAAKRRYLAVCTSKFRTRALCMSSHQKGDRYKIHTLILLKEEAYILAISQFF